MAQSLLNGAVHATTRPDRPAGCMGVQGALAAGEPAQRAQQLLTAWRQDGGEAIRARFEKAAAEGDLPPDSDPAHLARYVTTFAYGISVQAAGGVSREDLQQIADSALLNWPPTS